MGSMHARSWNRCLAFDPETGAWCRLRPTDGVFCSPHAREFRCDQAAKAATRLVLADREVRDPSTSAWRRRWAARQARRARSLRRILLAEIDGPAVSDTDVAITADDLVRTGDKRPG